MITGDQATTDFDLATLSVPIIDLSKMVPNSPFECAVLMELREIKETQSQLCTYMMDKEVVKMKQGSVDFFQKYNMIIPFSTLETFTAFDKNLKSNKFLKSDVVRKSLLYNFYKYS